MRNRRLALAAALLLAITSADGAALAVSGADFSSEEVAEAVFDEVESYHKWGGEALLGKSLMNCHNPKSKEIIEKVVAWFEEDKEHNRIHTFYNEKQAKDVYMVALRDEDGTLIGYYEKHEYRARDEEPYYNF